MIGAISKTRFDSPVLSLRRFRAETVLMLGIAISTILFNAKFRIWHADYSETWSRLRIDWWALEWVTNKEPWRIARNRST